RYRTMVPTDGDLAVQTAGELAERTLDATGLTVPDGIAHAGRSIPPGNGPTMSARDWVARLDAVGALLGVGVASSDRRGTVLGAGPDFGRAVLDGELVERDVHHDGRTRPVPPVVLLASALVLGTALFLDSRDMLSRRLALAGIFLGVFGVGVGVALVV
ncbi:MAG: hypothetical protein ACOC2A_03925, partial [Halanaeroarchaeum sp.]